MPRFKCREHCYVFLFQTSYLYQHGVICVKQIQDGDLGLNEMSCISCQDEVLTRLLKEAIRQVCLKN
ncbi:hypothetical protein D1AOALGA4SA_5811 [Olavius algarvensis Delta 1 endosymbiont]|nr:hypothetical protein D1AOALGA4SA_5811 [Olavius algarvensis Delta 1 endosymbiont]